MNGSNHWIRVEIAGSLSLEGGWGILRCMQDSPEKMADLVDFMHMLGGLDDAEYSRGLRGEYEDDIERRGTQSLRIADMLRGFLRIKESFSQDWRDNANLEECVLYLEYNPKDWFQDGEQRWIAHSSGRIVALAYTGVLKQQGFKVSGSDLPSEVCSD